MRDLVKTARVLSRFGPRLPALVEAQLIKAGNPGNPTPPPRRRGRTLVWSALVLAAFATGLGLGGLL